MRSLKRAWVWLALGRQVRVQLALLDDRRRDRDSRDDAARRSSAAADRRRSQTPPAAAGRADIRRRPTRPRRPAGRSCHLHVEFRAAFHRHQARLIGHALGQRRSAARKSFGLLRRKRLLEIDRQADSIAPGSASRTFQRRWPPTSRAELLELHAVERRDRHRRGRARPAVITQPSGAGLFNRVDQLVMAGQGVRVDAKKENVRAVSRGWSARRPATAAYFGLRSDRRAWWRRRPGRTWASRRPASGVSWSTFRAGQSCRRGHRRRWPLHRVAPARRTAETRPSCDFQSASQPGGVRTARKLTLNSSPTFMPRWHGDADRPAGQPRPLSLWER